MLSNGTSDIWLPVSGWTLTVDSFVILGIRIQDSLFECSHGNRSVAGLSLLNPDNVLLINAILLYIRPFKWIDD